MNGLDSYQGKVNRIVIVQSLPDDELQTGRRLEENIRDALAPSGIPIDVDLELVEGVHQLKNLLSRLRERCRASGLRPILHFECHGCKEPDGLVLSSGEIVEWRTLKPFLVEINSASRMNLFVTLASCYGAALGSLIELGDRAPFSAYVGAMHEVQAGQFADGYAAFYRSLLEDRNIAVALNTLRTRSGDLARYHYMTAVGLLRSAYARFSREVDTPVWRREWARRAQRQLRNQGAPQILSLDRLIEEMRDQKPKTMVDITNRFLMLDLHPENAERFRVSYEDLEAFAASENGRASQ